MLIINIPSVKSERCSVTLKFHEDKNGQPNAVDIECHTPVFTANLQVCIDENSLNKFIDELGIIENERKGECQFYDEWFFSLTISSADKLGHFKVKVWIQDIRDSMGGDQNDTLEFSYEIEPSLLISLVKDFNKLNKNLN